MTRLKVYDIYEETKYYINISSFAIQKEDDEYFSTTDFDRIYKIRKRLRKLNKIYFYYFKDFNKIHSILQKKKYYDKYFKFYNIVFVSENKNYYLKFKNKKERDNYFNKLIKE